MDFSILIGAGTSLLPWAFVIPTLPAFINSAIMAAEKPGASATDKESAVLDQVKAFITATPLTPAQQATIGTVLGVAKDIIAGQVFLMNTIGFFTHSGTTTPAPAPIPTPVPVIAPVPVDTAALKAALVDHIANMRRRLSEFQCGSDPLKDAHIATLTANIQTATDQLSKM